MPERPDPLSSMTRRQRWQLRQSMKRIWRMGSAEQTRATLESVRATVLGTEPSQVSVDGGTGEVTFADGTALRLTPCHRPTMRRLRALLADGAPYLARVAHHGQCWGLYFVGPHGAIPVLTRDLRVVPAGGRGRPSASRSPLGVPGGRAPVLV